MVDRSLLMLYDGWLKNFDKVRGQAFALFPNGKKVAPKNGFCAQFAKWYYQRNHFAIHYK